VLIVGGVSDRLAQIIPVGKFSEKLRIAGQTLRNLRARPYWLLLAFSASLVNWSTSIAAIWLVFRAFGSLVPLAAVLAYFPIAIFAGLIPFGIAGTGTRDGMFLALFAAYAPTAIALATSIAYTALGYLLFTGIGIVFLRHLRIGYSFSRQKT